MILAIDPASVTGWTNDITSGVEDFSLKKREDMGHRLKKFRSWLSGALNGVQMCVYEKPCGGRFQATRIHSQLEAIIILECDERGIGRIGVSASEIKKFATGKGNANKEMMVAAAMEKWPNFVIIDDNHADSLFLHDYAVNGGILNMT